MAGSLLGFAPYSFSKADSRFKNASCLHHHALITLKIEIISTYETSVKFY
jgi:hypothetical protein